MNKIIALLFFLALAPLSIRAQDDAVPTRYTVETVPQTEILSWSYVTDLSDVVSPSQKDSLNALCHFAKDSLQSEIAVVVLPAIDNGKYGSLHEFGVDLFNKWGIGGKDSEKGLLIVLTTAPGEREVVFNTGYGLEGALPDVYCKRIQSNVMVPYMKDGAYGSGLIAGVSAVNEILRGDVNPDELAGDGDEDEDLLWELFVVGMAIIIALCVVAVQSPKRRRKKMGKSITCRGCGVTGDMKYVRSEIIEPASTRHTGRMRHIYVCNHCGAENYVDEIIPRRPSGGGGNIGGTGFGGGRPGNFGGFGGGSFGGGSFGSFGGGMTGGGGSSTRF